MSKALNLRSTAKLSSGASSKNWVYYAAENDQNDTGYALPLLGLGAGANDDCVPACLAALKHGYRCVFVVR